MSNAICRYWASTGKCFYGEQCNFSHASEPHMTGGAGLPSQPQHQAQRPPMAAPAATGPGGRYCKTFAMMGYCKYEGNGCNLIHEHAGPANAPYGHDDGMAGGFQGQAPPMHSQPSGPPMHNQQFGGAPGPQAGFPPMYNQREREDYGHNAFVPPQQHPQHPQARQQFGGQFNPEYNPEFGHYQGGAEYYPPQVPQNGPPEQYYGGNPSDAYLAEQMAVQQGGTTYFYEQDEVAQAPQGFNPYAATLHQPAMARHGMRNISSFMLPPDVYAELKAKSAANLSQLGPDDPRQDLPSSVNNYHSLFPLDDPKASSRSKVFGYSTAVYKAMCRTDGLPYALRRIDGFRLSNEQALSMVDVWTRLQHSGIVSLRDVFFSKEFGSDSLCFVHDFYPCSTTVDYEYLSQPASAAGLLSEDMLWSFICQMISALGAIHRAGLASRAVDGTKILVTGKNRYRLACLGVVDVLRYDGGKNIQHFQQEDLMSLGKLVLCMACRSATAMENIRQSLQTVTESYSAALHDVIVQLVTKSDALATADDLSATIAPYLMREVEYLHQYTDNLEHIMSKEVENGRLFRLMVKLGFINERPEHAAMDPNWAETGDRYLLKLFRDYVFHQVYDSGVPVVDFGHVVDSLNKLDSGINEKLMLISRNEKSVLLVSYEDLKRSVDAAFGELVMVGKMPEGSHGQRPL